MSAMPVTDALATVWSGVDRLIDRSPSEADLRAHGLHLWAARRWRERGLQLSEQLTGEETKAQRRAAAVPQILQRAREVYDGSLLVFKGPEAAARYPTPTTRPFGDIDVLADDAVAAQRALVSAGFRRVGEHDDDHYADAQHLRPLVLPELSFITVEIHRRPNWPSWGGAPSIDEIQTAAVPASVGVDGLLAPSREHHALLLAAHAWVHAPLRAVVDLVDVLSVSSDADRDDLRLLARRWGIQRLWDATFAAAECVVLDGPVHPALRLWARDLKQVREQTVLENHLRHVAGQFSALAPHAALLATGHVLASHLRPQAGETWAMKARRTGNAIRHAAHPLAYHHRVVERKGISYIR